MHRVVLIDPYLHWNERINPLSDHKKAAVRAAIIMLLVKHILVIVGLQYNRGVKQQPPCCMHQIAAEFIWGHEHGWGGWPRRKCTRNCVDPPSLWQADPSANNHRHLPIFYKHYCRLSTYHAALGLFLLRIYIFILCSMDCGMWLLAHITRLLPFTVSNNDKRLLANISFSP